MTQLTQQSVKRCGATEVPAGTMTYGHPESDLEVPPVLKRLVISIDAKDVQATGLPRDSTDYID
jgi:hypothetical protein